MPQNTVSKKGEYWLESNFYCGLVKSNTVFVDKCPPDTIELYIPNSFSPNNDGMNDFFEPIPHNITLLKLEIYNSWGSLIYENQQDFKWDGMESYLPYPTDKYMFRVLYKDKNGKMGEKAGTVKLLRE